MNLPRQFIRPLIVCAALLGLGSTLTACVPLIIGGVAATTGMVVVDRRTVGQQVEDKSIELKIGGQFRENFGDAVRFTVNAYDGVVLLTGDTISSEFKTRMTDIARKVENVKSVSNQIDVVKQMASFNVVTNDIWITSKVMTILATTKDIPSRTIVVTTDRSVVYLMGLVTQNEGDLAAKAASQVSGNEKTSKGELHGKTHVIDAEGRVLRDNVVVFEGELESLRRFKEIVEDVRNGMECGIAVKAYNDVKVGDQIECFDRIEVQRTLTVN
jgi:osmotically-inducible protein OsmY